MSYGTSIKLDENIVGALCYIGFWITGVLFLLIERENRFVRYHAFQSALVFLPLTVIIFLISWIPYIGWLLADFGGFFALFLMLVLVVMAWRGSKIKIPIIGRIAYENAYGNK